MAQEFTAKRAPTVDSALSFPKKMVSPDFGAAKPSSNAVSLWASA
jgi:hypothetical protein